MIMAGIGNVEKTVVHNMVQEPYGINDSYIAKSHLRNKNPVTDYTTEILCPKINPWSSRKMSHKI
jgi:hypothetical protein